MDPIFLIANHIVPCPPLHWPWLLRLPYDVIGFFIPLLLHFWSRIGTFSVRQGGRSHSSRFLSSQSQDIYSESNRQHKTQEANLTFSPFSFLVFLAFHQLTHLTALVLSISRVTQPSPPVLLLGATPTTTYLLPCITYCYVRSLQLCTQRCVVVRL
jgi:hypothetical protein